MTEPTEFTKEEWTAFTDAFIGAEMESYQALEEWIEKFIQDPQEFVSDVTEEDIRLFVEAELEYLKTLFHSDFKGTP